MQAQKAVAANPAPTAVERAVRVAVPPLMFLAAFLVVMSHPFVRAEEFIHRGDDAYYYFKVAANFPDAGRWTFDTIHSTNGVQPLWAIILTSLAQLLSWFGITEPNTLARVFVAVTALLHFGSCIVGRSYGDSCLNDNGTLIATRRLDRFIAIDEHRGELVCEAGVPLGAILDLLASRRAADGGFWFLPVVPGTRFVTVGGAIANDVHGKNHGQAGSFGCHVNWLELARSDGSLVRCCSEENAELFRATIGGLGLTGLITSASLSLIRIPSLMVEVEDIPLGGLDDYFRVAEESRSHWTHHAAWIDVLAGGGRTRARNLHAPAVHALR